MVRIEQDAETDRIRNQRERQIGILNPILRSIIKYVAGDLIPPLCFNNAQFNQLRDRHVDADGLGLMDLINRLGQRFTFFL